MPRKKVVLKKKVSFKENLRKTVANQIDMALPALKKHLSEKKFKKRIKKAAKLLIGGIKEAKNSKNKLVTAGKNTTGVLATT